MQPTNTRTMNPIRLFIDADAFIAIADTNDSNHVHAIELQKRIDHSDIRLYTSQYAIGEAITVISQHGGLQLAILAGTAILTGNITIPNTTQVHMKYALSRMAEQTSKNSRLTDMINMALMDELKIDTIFSFDKHYAQNGYQLLG